MAESQVDVASLLSKLPTPDEAKRLLCRNLREARLLRMAIRLGEQAERVKEVSHVK